jgi:hypothetical protein
MGCRRRRRQLWECCRRSRSPVCCNRVYLCRAGEGYQKGKSGCRCCRAHRHGKRGGRGGQVAGEFRPGGGGSRSRCRRLERQSLRELDPRIVCRGCRLVKGEVSGGGFTEVRFHLVCCCNCIAASAADFNNKTVAILAGNGCQRGRCRRSGREVTIGESCPPLARHGFRAGQPIHQRSTHGQPVAGNDTDHQPAVDIGLGIAFPDTNDAGDCAGDGLCRQRIGRELAEQNIPPVGGACIRSLESSECRSPLDVVERATCRNCGVPLCAKSRRNGRRPGRRKIKPGWHEA